MKKHNLPIILSSIIALTVGTQSAHAFGLKSLWSEAYVAFSDAVVGTAKAVGDGFSEAVEVVCDGAVCAYKTVEKGVNDAIDNTAQFFVDTYNAVDEWGQELGRDIDRGLSDLREGIYEIKADASEFIQNGWRQLGQYYIKISDATTAWVRTKKCTFKYNIEAVGAGMKEIAALPSKRRAELFVCLERQNAWAKMVSKEGYVIGQNIPCFADFGMPHPERLIQGLVKVHNARLEAHRRVCGDTGGATFAKTNQTTPAAPTTLPVQATQQIIVNGVNCTGEGIAWGFGKNGVCSAATCKEDYERTHVGNEIYTCKRKDAPAPVKPQPGDVCTAKNASVAKINIEGNCAAMECVDGYELARFDNGNSKGFCIKSTPKVEPVVQEPVYIEPLETQVALLKVEPTGASDIILKMPEPALAVATPESNQVAETAPADATQSKLDKKLAKLDAKKDALIAKDQAQQLLAQQKAEEEELKRQQKELADFQKQQEAIAKAEAKQAEMLAKANEREAKQEERALAQAAKEAERAQAQAERQAERALAQAERQAERDAKQEERALAQAAKEAERAQAQAERQAERALAQAERQAERDAKQEERALAQAAKEAERNAQEKERQDLGLTQVEYNSYKKNQEKIEQMKIDVEKQRQQLNMA